MIYIVEDDDAIRELEQYALQSNGYEVASFASSEPFWQAMRTEAPELVILDVMLPGEDGFSILKKLRDGDIITFGNTQLEAIHVPGHSPGSIVFYCKEAHCIFSGDVLFQGSIGRADLTGGNFDELREHICSRLFVLPPDTVVYPGHGDPTTVGAEKANNPFFR